MLNKAIPPIVACLLLIVGAGVWAYPEIRFEHLSLEHGLAQSAVQDMAADDLGYMWFGTQYGLSRYDGYGFRNFRHEPDNPASLSNSRIHDMLRGSDGTLWVGTRSGLNRLDPETLAIERVEVSEWPAGAGGPEQPSVLGLAEDHSGNVVVQARQGLLFHQRDSGRLLSLPFEEPVDSDTIGRLLSDRRGRVWLLNRHGLWRMEPDQPMLRRVLEHPIDESHVRYDAMALLSTGELALAGNEGILLFDPGRERIVGRIRPTDYGAADDWVASLAADPRGYLWVLTRNELVQYDLVHDRWLTRQVRWQPEDASEQLGYRINMTRDQQGYGWIGLPEGVGLSSPDGTDFRLLRHDPGRPDSLAASPGSAVYKTYVDGFGTVWAGGGLGGLSRFTPHSARFEHVAADGPEEYFGTDNVVRSVLEQERDGKLYLWTGLSFSGLRVWERNNGTYDRIVATMHSLAPRPYRLPDNQVWELAIHPSSGDIWAGTDDGLVRISGSDFSVVDHYPVSTDGRRVGIKAMVFSEDGRRLWAAGARALMSFDIGPEGKSLVRKIVRPVAPEGVDPSEYAIFEMIRLHSGQLLVATRRGVVRWNPSDGSVIRDQPAGRPGEHPRNFIFGLAQTADGRLWLGSEQGGLARGSFRDGRFTGWHWYDRHNGLPDDTVYAILPGDSGRLWLSSNRGLIRFNPATGLARHFTLGDGLQSLEFNNTVATRGGSGLYYFGGIKGVNVFRPDDIQLHPQPPCIYLQRAEINGEPLSLNARRSASADTSHDHNSLLVAFVGLHFVEPKRNRYAYRLVGVDEQWVHSDSVRTARYPDLPPGDYRFLVKAANSDGVWSEARELLNIRVNAPPWMSVWAYSVYVAAAALLITGLLMAGRRRRRRLEETVATRTRELREQKELVDRQAGELEEVLNTRTTLFANISHEFRTPLTLIEAGIDRLSRNPQDAGAIMSARRYLRRLLRLVDQLLSLSRLQSARDLPVPHPWSIDQVIAMTVEAFQPLAQQRGISLEALLDGRWLTQCQQADVERILLNLIGNALKYCPAGSSVQVAAGERDGGILISVRDDGPGIPEGQRDSIFERFNRMPAHEHGRIEGAGIGLTLVREAARSNGGHAEVDSEPGEGAEFRVWLPAWRGHMEGAPVDQLAGQRLELELETLAPDADNRLSGIEGSAHGRYGLALVAEDNPDLRAYLSAALAGDWKVVEADDGSEALRLAHERLPDVVVSDIMMPRLDGLELLKRLRQDVRTSHLPVLLLTARQDEAARLQGYSLSADDFLAKPFDPAELRLRLRRMVDIRSRVQARLWRQMETSGQLVERVSAAGENSTPDLSERDERLLDRARNWLEANHDDPEASVTALAEFVAVEPRTLQRKLKALTGRTPAAHLQNYRLECARRMLRETERSIQDIALSCGFSSPQYFSRFFAQQEGLSPSKWRQRSRISS